MRTTNAMMAFLLVFAVAGSVRADEIKLKNGRVIQGKVRSKKDGLIEVERTYGMLKLKAEQVVSVKETKDSFDEFDTREAQMGDTEEARFQLASWCKKAGLTWRMRQTARAITARNTDHAGARELLGEVKFGNAWIPRSQALAKQGRVRKNGRWLTVRESNRLRDAKREQVRLKRVQRRMNSYVRRIYSSNPKTSKRGYLGLLALAKKEKIKGLRPIAARFYRDAEAQRAALSSGVVTVRMQQATLTGLDDRTVNLANGSPVRIQLPRTRLVGIGTTVGVPLR